MVDEAAVREVADRKLASRMLVKRELRALPHVLFPDEEIATMAAGAYEGKSGLLVATTKRVLFLDVGIGRERVEEFPYERIQGVEVETGLLGGKLTVFASGNRA
ncbi:MAG TPA: PH domain-containing protein, partial [Candidatus Thermoplasmatota archaeon]|nr:PH domain-containing protein [Candidatus Thermoplasmatota archaeon]